MTTRPRPFAQRVAAELRAELARQDKSGRWLAEQIGWSPATVARWIGGDTDPDLDGLEAMCRAMGMSVADLLDAVQRNGGYEVLPLPAPRPTRNRRVGGAAVADTAQASSRDTREYVPAGLAA